MSELSTGEAATASGAQAAAGMPHAEIGRGVATLGTMTSIYGLWLAVAALYWPTTLALNALWTAPSQEETFTHGYLILLIALWLIWRERRALAAEPVRFQPLALVPLVLLSAVWVWSWRAAIQELHMMLVPVILFTAIVAALGPRVARLMVFPIGYLYFALPFWTGGVGILQALSARMTGVLMWLTGLPGFMRGNFIELPAGTIQIAGGCSGLHSFIVGLALAAVYGKLFDLPMCRRWGAVALMGTITLVVNWVRIFIVTAVAYATDMHSPLVHHHYWLGWWLFAAAFAGFLWWMERKPQPRQSAARAAQPAHSVPSASVSRSKRPRIVASIGTLALALAMLAAVVAGLYVSLRRNYYHHFWIGWSLCIAVLGGVFWWVRRRHVARAAATATEKSLRVPVLAHSGTRLMPIVAALAALAVLPAAAYGIDWAHASDNPTVLIQWPSAPTRWEGPERAIASPWHPYFVHAGGESLRAYTSAQGQTVQVFAVAYRVQTQRAKLLGYLNRLLGKTSGLRAESRHIVNSPAGQWLQTRIIDGAGQRSLIWSRYRVGSREFVHARLSQAWYGLAAIFDPPLSSLTALRTACRPDCGAARARLSVLARAVQPKFSAP